MRIALAGTRSFGVAALDALLGAGHDVAAVFAPLDDKLTERAILRGVRSHPFMDDRTVRLYNLDLIVCAHSHLYIGRESRGATRLGALGYHPSLLPRHRGRDAVQWTVRMGDPVAGGSVYWFDNGVDTGPIAAQDWCFVGARGTANELWRDKLFPMGLELLLAVLKDLDNGKIVAIPQDQAYATWEPSLDSAPLYRPELPELGAAPAGFDYIGSREDPRL